MSTIHARAVAVADLWDRCGMQGLRHPFPELAGAIDDLDDALELDDGTGIIEASLAFVRIWDAAGMQALRDEFREAAVAVDLLELALQTNHAFSPSRGGWRP
jgi:hypothetical protein